MAIASLGADVRNSTPDITDLPHAADPRRALRTL
jgi:hypothetical protein